MLKKSRSKLDVKELTDDDGNVIPIPMSSHVGTMDSDLWAAKTLDTYKLHLEKTKQLEEILDVFRSDERSRALEMMKTHDSLPELFMLFLEYLHQDPEMVAKHNAVASHQHGAKTRLEARSTFLEKRAEKPKLTQKQFARDCHFVQLEDYQKQEKQLEDLASLIGQTKDRLKNAESKSQQELIRQERKTAKEKMVELKTGMRKPYSEKTIAGWLAGVEPLKSD